MMIELFLKADRRKRFCFQKPLMRYFFLQQGARFRDISQQIYKQWQADPARAFPTVGKVNVNSISPVSGELSTPNSTPSSSPSPVNNQQIMVSIYC